MTTYLVLVLVAFAVMLLAVLGMASGVLAGRNPIAGSCGGIANLGIEKECSICGGDRQKCDDASASDASRAGADLAYDASSRK